MTFEDLVDRARAREPEAVLALFEKYRPMMISSSFDEAGQYDPDLQQELCHRFLIVLQQFDKERALGEATRTALVELGMEPSIDHITDFAQIAAYGVMTTPALVVDGKVVS